jgi:hypothetical protein
MAPLLPHGFGSPLSRIAAERRPLFPLDTAVAGAVPSVRTRGSSLQPSPALIVRRVRQSPFSAVVA